MDKLAEIAHKFEIQELLSRYATMVDQRQWHLMDHVFAPGATIDYRSTGGKFGPYKETLEWLHRALEPWPINLHFITNVQVDLHSESTAASVCYFHAPMGRVADEDGQVVITNAGRYEDDLTRDDHGWRIAKRHCEQTIMVGQLPEGYAIPE